MVNVPFYLAPVKLSMDFYYILRNLGKEADFWQTEAEYLYGGRG